ncbi:tetratricopeptide repeat protein, partial [bacterium]|nr:tetratricopeptide repeat protein [bacterium]
MALSPVSCKARWSALLLLFFLSGCKYLIYSPDNPFVRVEAFRPDLIPFDMPVVGLFAFVPVDIPPDDTWIGRALSVGVSLRLQSDAGFALMEPARFTTLLGTPPYRLDGLPDELEVTLMAAILPKVTIIYGDYTLVDGEVTVRLLLPGEGKLLEVFTTTGPEAGLRGMVTEVSEALVGLVADRDCPDDAPGEGCDLRHDYRLPATTEGLHHFTNATAYFEARWLDHAVDELVSLLALEPGFVPAAKDLLRTYNHRGQAKEMVAVLTSFAGARDDPDIQFYLGLVHFNNGDFRLAEQAFRIALALDPSLSEAHVFLASIANAEGNDAARRRAIHNFLRRQEDSGVLRSRILRLSTFQGQPQVLTLVERWRGRTLPLLPPGSMPASIDLTLRSLAAPAVIDEDGNRAGFPTATLADADGVWV